MKEILEQIKRLSEQNKALAQKLKDATDDDLETDLQFNEPKKHKVMFDIDPDRVDGYGDPVELLTKSRLRDATDAFDVAATFTHREYHHMMGNHYGKHSKLIPVYNDDGSKNQDIQWYQGYPITIVEDKDGRLYYKIRMLIRDILTKKLLISKIAIESKGREEEIHLSGASRHGMGWIMENAPLYQLRYPKTEKNKKVTLKKVDEVIFAGDEPTFSQK